jgi:hypothetical protein
LKEKKDNTLSDEGFAEWYRIYPRKKQPRDAKRAFDKVIGSGLISLASLMEKTKAFAAGWDARPSADRKFIPYPASWLNAGGYDDEPDVSDQPSTAPAPRDPKSFNEADWIKRLDHFQSGKPWLSGWGAAPGEPGCMVPGHLILKPVASTVGAA